MIAVLVAALLSTGPDGDFPEMVAAVAEQMGCEAGAVWKAQVDDERGGDVRLVEFSCPDDIARLVLFTEHEAGDWYPIAPEFHRGAPAPKPKPRKAGKDI